VVNRAGGIELTTRLKTVEFAHPPYTSAITDNTLTTMSQITVYLPESGKTFRSVVATVSACITDTAAGNLTTRQLQCRLGAAGYTTHTNSNAITNSTEDITAFHSVDLTSHFTTNWSGTSMTFDSQVLFDSAATTPGAINACVTLVITYEYDDTSSTQIKTVRFPLNAPVGALATSKPGSPTDTLPALDTELPEASKVYRNIFTTVQGNYNHAAVGGTADSSITQQWVSSTAHTSGTYEGALATDYWFRYVWNCGVGGSNVLVTNTTQAYYIYASHAKFNHLQVWLTVTYEFDATSSNDMFVSLMLPNDFDSPMGGTTSSDYQRTTREVFIQETGITSKQIAYFPHWSQIAAISTLNFRVGTGSFVTYTDAAAAVAGGNGAMVRNDAAFTLARGRNTLTFDAYRSDTADLGWSLSGFWIVNYTADKPSGGYGAANHTVIWNLGATVFDGAATQTSKAISATAPVIPETDYYMTALGVRLEVNQNGTTQASSYTVLFEKTSGEGGVQWQVAYKDVVSGDVETGLFTVFGQIKDFFKRWPDDPESGRLDIETSRRWVIYNGYISGQGLYKLDLLMTYHTITYAVAGTVSGSAGGTVTLTLHRANTGEEVKSTTRSGNGAFSLTWYDNTENVFVEATEDATHVGRTIDGLAGT
jgi:hypothetical protein